MTKILDSLNSAIAEAELMEKLLRRAYLQLSEDADRLLEADSFTSSSHSELMTDLAEFFGIPEKDRL